MIPLDKYPHIPYWFSVREAIALIHHSELDIDGRKSLARAVLVFDEEYKLLGMVRRRDFLRALEPHTLMGKDVKHSKKLFDMDMDPNLLELGIENLEHAVNEKAEVPIGEIMVPIKQTVDVNDHIMKIINEMVEYHQSMLAVTKDGLVVGVIRTVEVMDEIVKILGIE